MNPMKGGLGISHFQLAASSRQTASLLQLPHEYSARMFSPRPRQLGVVRVVFMAN